MHPRMSAITLGVEDLPRARRFYEALGWQAGYATDTIVFFQLPGVVFTLFPKDTVMADIAGTACPGATGRLTFAYHVPAAAEVDRMLDAARAAGASIVRPARTMPGNAYAGFFTDPDGHPWEIAYDPQWTAEEPSPEAAAGE